MHNTAEDLYNAILYNAKVFKRKQSFYNYRNIDTF